MNEEDLINKLASRARLENAPEVDVVGCVIARLERTVEEELPSFAPLAWIAAASAAAAVPIAILAIAAWDAWTVSLVSIISEIPWGIL